MNRPRRDPSPAWTAILRGILTEAAYVLLLGGVGLLICVLLALR